MVEGSAFCLVFCSTLAALVSVIPVLRSLRGWVLWEPLEQFALNKTPPARPNLGFYHLPPSLFSLGFPEPEGHLYLNPRASAPLSVGPNYSPLQRHLRETQGLVLVVRITYPVCPENEISAAPIGICRHIWVALLDLFYHCRDVLQPGF